MYGSVTHYLKSIASGIGVAVLDTRDIDISKVYDVQAKKELSWAVYPFEYITGMKNEQLVITLDHATRYNEVLEIRIEYKTSPDATAVNWVPENQTLSGDLKYMYTQCEAIQCRSIVPIQDSPAVKSTFNATLRVEAPYVAIASALLVNKTEIARRDGSGKVVVYKYAQSIPVPSYLLALVAGHIGFQMSGRRAGVYAEPAILEKSVNELSEMDAFMSIVSPSLLTQNSSRTC